LDIKAMPAKPFLRPAFASQKNRALDAIKAGLAKAIQKAAEKAKWK
jgi:hypothetical protein